MTRNENEDEEEDEEGKAERERESSLAGTEEDGVRFQVECIK